MQNEIPQMNPPVRLVAVVQRAARRRRAAGMLWLLGWVLLGLAALSALLGNHVSERTGCLSLCWGMLAGVVVLFAGWYWQRRRLAIRALCREFQRECPEDRDRLETALELEATPSRTPFQQEYLGELHRRYLSDGGKALLGHRVWRPCWHGMYFAVLCLCIGGLALVGRGGWLRWYSGLFAPDAIALSEDLPTRIPVHQDLRVEAEIRRYGTQDGVFLESFRDGVLYREAMDPENATQWGLTLYDLAEETRYRVVTRFATSPWRTVQVYDPPAPLAVAIDTRPPAYTRQEPRHYDDFQDLELLEGEAIVIQCQMPQGQTWELLENGSGELFSPPVDFLPRHKLVYHPHYRSELDQADGPAFRVSIQADQPPLLELLAPEEDQEIAPEAHPQLVAMVSDDYGVAEVSLHYVVDDGDEQTIPLWAEEPTQNVDLDEPLDFGALAPGQVVTGWLSARDNREALPQAARSSLFFLSVIPPDDSESLQNEGGNQSGESQEVTIQDLIAESKRLLRGTLDAMERKAYLPPEIAFREQHELSRDLRALGVAITGRQVTIAKSAGVAELPPELAEFFTKSTGALEEAGDLVEQGALAQSRKPQQVALTQLTHLAWLLLQNTRQMAQAQQGQSSEKNGQSQEGKKESTAQKGDRSFDLQQLQQALAELRRLRQEEERLLGDFSVTVAPTQRTLARQTEELSAKIAPLSAAIAAVPPLREATRELAGSAASLEQRDADNGLLRARRAVQAFQAAEELLQEALRKESRQQLDRLVEKADQLAQEQRQLAEQSRQLSQGNPISAEKKDAQDAQKTLLEKSRRFREEVTGSLQSLSRQFPQAAEALSRAMRSSAADQMQGAQTRAQNALLYGRFDKASASQDRAADAMEQWRDDLSAAGEGIPKYTPEELQQALEELQRRAEELAQAQGDGEVAEAQQNATAALGGYAQQFHSEELQHLADEIGTGTAREAYQTLESAREILRQELSRMLGEEAVKLLQRNAPPPRKYRPQAQEYFRRLNEDLNP